MMKRQRTPSEKIKAWMASAEFSIRPEPDVELGFPTVRTVYADNIETPRLGGRSSWSLDPPSRNRLGSVPGGSALDRPVIASDGEVEQTNEASREDAEQSSPSSSSSPSGALFSAGGAS